MFEGFHASVRFPGPGDFPEGIIQILGIEIPEWSADQVLDG